MKKIVLLIILLLTSGCTVEYNLTINDNELVEDIHFSNTATEKYSKEFMKDDYQIAYPIYYDQEPNGENPYVELDDQSYYEKKLIETINGYDATYKSNYSFNNFSRARSANTAFSKFNVGYNKDENYYYLSANRVKLFDRVENNNLSKININITINNPVIYHNADKVEGNKYIWYVDINNYDTKSVQLHYTDKQDTSSIIKEDNKQDINTIVIIVLAMTLFVVSLAVIIKIKGRKL